MACAVQMSGITWTKPIESLIPAVASYEQRVMAAVVALFRKMGFAGKIEAYAKQNAPWTDRTGNARQTLFTVEELAGQVLTLYLSHGMEYGKWLELCNSGRYAIVMKTLEAHYGQIKSAMDALFAD